MSLRIRCKERSEAEAPNDVKEEIAMRRLKHEEDLMPVPPVIPDHTLLRVIGRGSYGEVWLARNVMGTLRAVKIVRRDAFDSARPYLREFEGIRRCEPVSRAHDGLVDILHMGRNDAEGWFYYVMELADSMEGAEYRAATLSARLEPGRMLDITECLRIAESLAGALAFLHEQGLIHRDVKPSNVLYAGGVPKLGDIGLVAEAGSSRSFVGTEGFVPHEGPGTERADIYALGKVLYEALTGMDRAQFPLLPREWREAYDFDQRVELNEIVLRACEGQRERRYATAREMLADVVLVASGRSVKKLRGMEGRLRLLKWTGASAATVAVAALGISWMGRRQAEQERALRGRAEAAEAEARHEHHAAMLGQVRAARRDATGGAVTAALATASELARLHPTPELRDEAVFLLGRSDLVPREDLRRRTDNRACAVAPVSGLSVVAEPGPGAGLTLQFSRAGGGPVPRDIVMADPPPGFLWPEFSPDGQRLLLPGWFGAGVVLDTASGEVLARIPAGGETTSLLRWCGPDGSRLLRRSQTGALVFYAVPGGARTMSGPVDWPVASQAGQPFSPSPSPDGGSVVLVHRGRPPQDVLGRIRQALDNREPPSAGSAALVDCATGRVRWKVDGPDDLAVAWSPDGTQLALRSGGVIRVHDADDGAVVATVPGRIHNAGTRLCFLGSSSVLAFSTWSHSGWYDVVRQQLTPGLPCSPVHFDPATRLLWSAESSGIAAAEWRPSRVLRVLTSNAGERQSVRLSFSADSRRLVASNTFEFRCFDMETPDAPPAVLQAAGAAAAGITPAAMLFFSRAGVHRVPAAADLPTALPAADLPEWLRGVTADFADLSADGATLAIGGPGGAFVVRGETVRHFPTGDSGNPVSLSPDGHWLALGSQHGGTVRVWDLTNADEAPVHVCRGRTGSVPLFSPDGSRLVCAMQDANILLRTGSWEELRRLPRDGGGPMGFPAFSRDGRRLVLPADHRTFEVRDGTTLALQFRLTPPLEEQATRLVMSPDGRFVAAVGARQEICLWDLAALTSALDRLGMPVPP